MKAVTFLLVLGNQVHIHIHTHTHTHTHSLKGKETLFEHFYLSIEVLCNSSYLDVVFLFLGRTE